MVKVDFKLSINLSSIDSSLVDFLQEAKLRTSILQIVLASQDQCDVVDDPFSVDPHELMSEWVCCEILDLLTQREIIV